MNLKGFMPGCVDGSFGSGDGHHQRYHAGNSGHCDSDGDVALARHEGDDLVLLVDLKSILLLEHDFSFIGGHYRVRFPRERKKI